MKVIIADGHRLNIYPLPDKIEDEFLINYVSQNEIEETIMLTAENSKWNISSNSDSIVYKDHIQISKEALIDGGIYEIKFSDLEGNVMLYCYETPISYFKFEIGNLNNISLGRQGNFEIIYDSAYLDSPTLTITKVTEGWLLQVSETTKLVYLNKELVKQAYLRLGDTIFINGLKIIWMNTFMIINNPNNAVMTSLPLQSQQSSLINNTYTPVKDTDKNITLYTENQVFFHTPRIKQNITPKKIKIDNPPARQAQNKTPAILTYGASIMMGISSSITGIIAVFNTVSGNTTIIKSIAEIIVCVAMIASSLLLPIIQEKYQKRKDKKDEDKRQKKYSEYLEIKKKEISEEILKQTDILFKNNLNIDECKNTIINKTSIIWCREIPDSDFLTLRLGTGTKKAEIEVEVNIEEFSMDDDNLREQVKNIKDSKFELQNVPITISMIENKVLPIVINSNYQYKVQYINWIILQLITYYSGMDLKIAILTTKQNEHIWDNFKYLSHCYDKDRTIRLFATDEEEYKTVTMFLNNEYSERKKIAKSSNESDITNTQNNSQQKLISTEDYKLFEEYYLIITDTYLNIKKYDVINEIINNKKNIGFSLLTIEETMSTIPSRCNKFIEITNSNGTVFSKDETNQEQQTFIPELLNEDINTYSRIVANIPTAAKNKNTYLPASISFLEMYKVGKIEQLNIINRWENNNPTLSLNTPIGIRENGKIFELDLHEKFHGPHGLIAGSTGSGKSEFIITFILSMAVNYSPEEVQFVLIDYKGGGLAGAFENKEKGIKIPHLIGTITNLDTNEMNRSLVSINSELKRRETVFNKTRDSLGESTIDIYKYQKLYREGKVQEPVSHLFIISDEFAELKAQQPEFMTELVSAARIGRSLGVHLILATQKPSGVVDDQIWSNSKFKICLKVQTTEDSNEMLKRPEAASIKETGRFYLQVGTDEIFDLGQSAWAGAKYTPTDRIIKYADDSIDIIDKNGNILTKIAETKTETFEDIGDQVTNIVRYLDSVSKRENIVTKSLWLPSIPSEIFINNTIAKYSYKAIPYNICPIIGEYDNPAKQKQDILALDITNGENLIIYGNTGSGKENLLATMIYSTIIYHTPEEVNFYLFDFGAETLKAFSDAPQVGDIILIDEEEKIKSGLLWLNREITRRKELFSDYGGNYKSYIEKKEKLPLIVSIVNMFEPFRETYVDYADYLPHLIRDGGKYGIVFILTTTAVNSIPSTLAQLFSNKLAMQLNDSFDYKYTFNAPYGLTPAKYFGRGIITINDEGFEFQTALINNKNEISDKIKQISEILKQKYPKAKKIPIIPSKITIEKLAKYIDSISNIPVGINIHDGEIATINLEPTQIYQISGNYILSETDFLNDFISTMNELPHTKVKVIDFVETPIETENIEYISDEYTKAINNIITSEKESTQKMLYIIIGISKMSDCVLDEGVEKMNLILNNTEKFKNSRFIIIDNPIQYNNLQNEEWYTKNVNKQTGLWIGKNFDGQKIIEISNVTKMDINESFIGLAYNCENGNYKVIKSIGNAGEDDSY